MFKINISLVLEFYDLKSILKSNRKIELKLKKKKKVRKELKSFLFNCYFY